VRSAGSNLQVEAAQVVNYVLSGNPAATATLTASPSSPQEAGGTVTLTAGASGGNGNYQYQFLIKAPGGTWVTVQNYSSSNSYSWNTAGLAAGIYNLTVYTRNQGSTSAVEAAQTIAFTISPPPVSSASLVAAPASPVTAGALVKLTAGATGGSGSYEYKFLTKAPGGNWVTVQNYSSSNTYDWNTTGLVAGLHNLAVYVRNQGSLAYVEAYQTIGFNVMSPPAASATLTTAPASPQPVGASITLTAGAFGGSGNYQYQFFVKAPGGNWVTVQGYSTNSSYTWNTTGLPPGIYNLTAYARNVGATSAVEAAKTISFTLQ